MSVTAEGDGKMTDLAIFVMGRTGVGKSTFINTALGQQRMEVNHMRSTACTTKLYSASVDSNPRLETHRLVLVDTPGLHGIPEHDERIFQQIDAWIDESHRKMMYIGGVIYLHDLAIDRLSSAERRNLERITILCRGVALGKVALVTTHLGKLTDEDHERRTNNLSANYWKEVIEDGGEIYPFRGDTTSARRIIEAFRPPVKDVVIPILGPTGVGKSTFIRVAVEEQMKVTIGHGTTSCTTEPFPVIVDPIPGFPRLKGYRLILLDTPGFDDTHETDAEILKRIAQWLAESYGKKISVGGVLYLHDITTKRLTGTARQNLEIFSCLCGNSGISQALMVTTNWQRDAPRGDLERREVELKDGHWKKIVKKGGEVRRFLGDSKSAWEIINAILERAQARLDSIDPLQIQQELIDLRMGIPETQAGKELRFTLEQLIKMYKVSPTLVATVTGNGDPTAPERLEDVHAKINSLKAQIQTLKLTPSKRLLRYIHIK